MLSPTTVKFKNYMFLGFSNFKSNVFFFNMRQRRRLYHDKSARSFLQLLTRNLKCFFIIFEY